MSEEPKPIPMGLLGIAQARITKDYLGHVPGLHGVALGVIAGQPAIILLATTPRPPTSHRIPERLCLRIEGELYAAPIGWLQAGKMAPTNVVPDENGVVIDAP